MDKIAREELFEAILTNARRHGINVDVVAEEEPGPGADAHQVDALIRIGRGGESQTYAAEIKRGLRPATLGVTLHHIERLNRPGMLLADYVTPPMAETLKARAIAFLDAAGNAYINQPPILVWVKGERPRKQPTAEWNAGRVFQPGGLKVVFALLCNPEWTDQPYREIAGLAGVAHGTVGAVAVELQKLGFIAYVNGKRRLLERDRLLRQWAEAYVRTLRPKLMLGRYDATEGHWWKGLTPAQYGVLLGGEPAAEKLTRHLRSTTVTLYGDKVESRLLLDFKLRPGSDGSVEVVKRFWAFDSSSDGLVPLPLVYADLLMTGDARCLEAADLIYERILDGLVGTT